MLSVYDIHTVMRIHVLKLIKDFHPVLNTVQVSLFAVIVNTVIWVFIIVSEYLDVSARSKSIETAHSLFLRYWIVAEQSYKYIL